MKHSRSKTSIFLDLLGEMRAYHWNLIYMAMYFMRVSRSLKNDNELGLADYSRE